VQDGSGIKIARNSLLSYLASQSDESISFPRQRTAWHGHMSDVPLTSMFCLISACLSPSYETEILQGGYLGQILGCGCLWCILQCRTSLGGACLLLRYSLCVFIQLTTLFLRQPRKTTISHLTHFSIFHSPLSPILRLRNFKIISLSMLRMSRILNGGGITGELILLSLT
jgi:hypothetical protein